MDEYARKMKESIDLQDEYEKKKRMDFFSINRKNAIENLNKSIKRKEDDKAEVIATNKKYSPLSKKMNATTAVGFTNTEDKRAGSPTHKPLNVEPEYDDLFNSVFYKKKHKAY